jgi:hypothetical protein
VVNDVTERVCRGMIRAPSVVLGYARLSLSLGRAILRAVPISLHQTPGDHSPSQRDYVTEPLPCDLPSRR